jgi:hypothetical protein
MKDDLETISWKVRVQFIGMLSFLRIQTMKRVKTKVMLSLKKEGEPKNDWMIPIEFQSDISHIHQKAGFTQVGL